MVRWNWQELSGDQFEHYLHDLFTKLGYIDVVNRPLVGDGGIDLEVQEKGLLTKFRIAVEAKNIHSKKIDKNIIHKLNGALRGENSFNEGIVVTSSSFNKSAIALAKDSSIHISLVNGENLNKFASRYHIPPISWICNCGTENPASSNICFICEYSKKSLLGKEKPTQSKVELIEPDFKWDWKHLSKNEFEGFILNLLPSMGLKNVKLATEKAKLSGIDIEAEEVGLLTKAKYGIEWIYETDKPVSRGVIQQLESGLSLVGCSRGIVITPGRFSHNAVEFSKNNPKSNIILIDGAYLNKLANTFYSPQLDKLCVKCNAVLSDEFKVCLNCDRPFRLYSKQHIDDETHLSYYDLYEEIQQNIDTRNGESQDDQLINTALEKITKDDDYKGEHIAEIAPGEAEITTIDNKEYVVYGHHYYQLSDLPILNERCYACNSNLLGHIRYCKICHWVFGLDNPETNDEQFKCNCGAYLKGTYCPECDWDYA